MSKKTTPPPKKNLPKTDNSYLLDRWESAMEKGSSKWLIASLMLSVLFSILLFDIKISDLNDDSLYIEGGYNFAEDIHHAFTANAPLYPLILSIPIKFFGINLFVLKSLSVLFTTLHLYILFLAFRKRIPYLVIIPVMILLAVNSYIQYFASLTFTESLYMMLQALFIYYFFNVLEKTKGDTSIKTTWKYWILLGVVVFLLNFCKNIAIGAAGAVVLLLIMEKRWMHLLYAIGGIAIIRVTADMIRTFIWGNSQFASQSSLLMQVDPYNPSKGLETFSGFVQRFLDNTSLYISKRLYQILGFISPDSTATKAGLIFITIVFFIIALIAALRNKNHYILFSIFFSLVMMALTFIVLQKQWDQPRMILIYVPYILIIIYYGIFQIFRKTSAGIIYILFISIFTLSSFLTTARKSADNIPKLKKNLAGDQLYGYTEDWVNMLKMSRYCADSLPANSYVASRKAPMSFVYSGGKRFYPVYTVFSTDADSVLNTFKQEKVTHIMIASLRRNPKKIDGYTINTFERLLSPVAKKYPEKLVLVKKIGETEPAYLYEIKY